MRRSSVDARRLHWASLEAEQVAAAAELASTQARLAADSARFSEPMDEDTDVLTSAAARLEWTAAIRIRLKPPWPCWSTRWPLKRPSLLTTLVALQRSHRDTSNLSKLARQGPRPGKRQPTANRPQPMRPGSDLSCDEHWSTPGSGPMDRGSEQSPNGARGGESHLDEAFSLRRWWPPSLILVATGKHPRIPKLLDWLATDLMDHQWGMKRLHRLIVTSGVYRMTSSGHRPPIRD